MAGVEVQHGAHFAVFEGLLVIGLGEGGEHQAVCADGSTR